MTRSRRLAARRRSTFWSGTHFGDEFATRARELIPGVPMLFVTGYAEPGRVRQRTEGDILKKPFRRAQLAEKLRNILRIPPVDQINEHLKQTGWYDKFPPDGVEIVAWHVMMGIGQVVIL